MRDELRTYLPQVLCCEVIRSMNTAELDALVMQPDVFLTLEEVSDSYIFYCVSLQKCLKFPEDFSGLYHKIEMVNRSSTSFSDCPATLPGVFRPDVHTVVLDHKYLVHNIRLGGSSYGDVFMGVERDSRQCIVVKVVVKMPNLQGRPDEVKRMKREKIISSQMNHVCIVKVEAVVEEQEAMSIVMELAWGRTLLEEGLLEAHAKIYAFQILLALKHLHENDVMHQDLKLANILLSELVGADRQPVLMKITDFRLAKFVDPNKKLFQICSTPYYRCPEMEADLIGYWKNGDVWSFGIILFKKICRCGSSERSFSFDKECRVMELETGQWGDLSKDAKYILKRMLNQNLNEGLSAAQAVEHRWFTNHKCLDAAFKLMGIRVPYMVPTSEDQGKLNMQAIRTEVDKNGLRKCRHHGENVNAGKYGLRMPWFRCSKCRWYCGELTSAQAEQCKMMPEDSA